MQNRCQTVAELAEPLLVELEGRATDVHVGAVEHTCVGCGAQVVPDVAEDPGQDRPPRVGGHRRRHRVVEDRDDAAAVEVLARAPPRLRPDQLDAPELAARWLRHFDPEIDAAAVALRITGPEQLRPLLEGADVLVHAADSPPYELERWVNAACLDAVVPWITSAQNPPILKVGPLYVPGRTACFACHERQLARDHELWPLVVRTRCERPVVATTLGPASGALGALIGLQLLDLLTDDELPATAGRAQLIDMRALTSRFVAVSRDPECPACGGT